MHPPSSSLASYVCDVMCLRCELAQVLFCRSRRCVCSFVFVFTPLRRLATVKTVHAIGHAVRSAKICEECGQAPGCNPIKYREEDAIDGEGPEA